MAMALVCADKISKPVSHAVVSVTCFENVMPLPFDAPILAR
jgi:hypothetical protein